MENKQQFRKKAELINRVAQGLISTGGYGVIIIIVAMLAFLIYQVMPLTYDAAVVKTSDHNFNTRIRLAGIDQYQEVVYALDGSGVVRFFYMNDSVHFASDSLDLHPDEKITCATAGQLTGEIFSAGTDQGRILVAEIRMRPQFDGNKRHIIPEFRNLFAFQAAILTDTLPAHIESLVYRKNDSGDQFWMWKDHAGIYRLQINDEYDATYRYDLNKFADHNGISAVEIDPSGEKVILGTDGGHVYVLDMRDKENLSLINDFQATDASVTAIVCLMGNNTLVIGDSQGLVSSWLPVKSQNGVQDYRLNHKFLNHNSSISGIAVSARNRTFVTYDQQGGVHLNYCTTGQTRAEFSVGNNAVILARIAPKSDGILLVDSKNRLGHFSLSDEHPEATLNSLFGKVWYEGYNKSEFVWQSTGGSDEFEPKFSLIPLIFGTLKGTLYAMIFSIPLALLAAIYVSQFAPKWLARSIKPTIEIMAALPSVVIGFLAGLYFSPVLEKYLSVAFLAIFIIPLVIFTGILIWRFIPEALRERAPVGWELLFITPLIIFAMWLAIHFARPVEFLLFSGDIKQWLYEGMGITYDQRNSIVVGFALGFAVIPTIFTISEDALSNVPGNLTSASLALGASRWQTVKYIIIPAAAGGIFAATMLGLGRAIGETMIVLMATGNTPIMDLSPFNGFRAMSACIAVEIPEAPVGGTLFHILFLTALLLFAFTFLLNTLAAFIGDKLRKKYARF